MHALTFTDLLKILLRVVAVLSFILGLIGFIMAVSPEEVIVLNMYMARLSAGLVIFLPAFATSAVLGTLAELLDMFQNIEASICDK